MRIIRTAAIAAITVAALACPAASLQEDGREWIAGVGRAYQEFVSYQCEGVIRAEFSGLQSGAQSTSFARYAKPKEYKFRYNAGMGASRYVVACDGVSTAVYSAGARQYTIRPSARADEIADSGICAGSECPAGGISKD